MNKQKDIADLYNSLFKLEAKFKKEKAYPIHKRLHFEDKFEDIYDFLATKLEVKSKTILDAGCGVGYGSLLLAKKEANHVYGISISDLEINQAQSNKASLGVENVTFEIASFDMVKETTFDLIFCVESLKHSLHFENSFQTLLKSLKPEGKLCIVDDFFEGHENKKCKEFRNDWNLNFILSQSDLKVNPAIFDIKTEDLTSWMPKKSILKLHFQLFFFKWFKSNSMFKKLFKGGLLLDLFYAKKEMKYLMVVITKTE